MILNFVLTAFFAAAAVQKPVFPWSEEKTPDYDAAKYWNREELFRTPSCRPCTLPESQWKGLDALFVKGKGPKNAEAEFFCYYGRPEGPVPEGGFPGLVMVHGGGCTAYPIYAAEYVKKGFAVIALDWYNQRPAPALTNNPPPYAHSVPCLPLEGGRRQDHIANVANIILAHSLLRSFPEVNKDRTVYSGLSWGSWYGGCVTAVDDRYKGAVFIYLADRKPWKKEQGHDFIMGGRFLRSCKVPAWWFVWPVDGNGTPRTMQDSWDIFGGGFRGNTIIHNAGHGPDGFRSPAVIRMTEYFAGLSARLPFLSHGEIKDGVLSAKILDPGAGVAKAKLWYTFDDWNPVVKINYKRKFESAPATIDGKTVSAKVPSGTKLCWISAYEEKQPDARRNDCCGCTGFHFGGAAGDRASFRKFVWVELLGFDNARKDFGVADWLSRQPVKPEAVSLLLEDIEFFHAHAGFKEDLPLPASVCAYGARPGNEERPRQNWTAGQLRGLVAELKRQGLDVYPSFFERGLFDITRKVWKGEPYVDFFIRQTLAFLKDYGFTGLHAADGFGHPRYGIDTWFRAGYTMDGRKVRFARDETDWRKAAEDWTAFWRKAAHAIKAQGYKLYLNTVWTRDPYEALVRYGEDYDALCETEIDGFICESSASVLELEGWNWDEESTLDKSVAMLNRMAACVKGRKELLLLHCIKDGCEQYNALRHSPIRAIAEAVATAGVRFGPKRALCGEMECLADGISPSEWKLLDDTWRLAFSGAEAVPEGVRVVWSDRGFRREADMMSKLECASSSTLLAMLVHRGAALGGMIDVREALANKSIPLVLLNPSTLPEEELAALKDRTAEVIELGAGVDAFPVEPTWERKLVWPFPMYEKRPEAAAVERTVSRINALAPLAPVKKSVGVVSVQSARRTDGSRTVVLRNLTSHYHTARIRVPEDVREAHALTADLMLPVSVETDKEGVRQMKAKLPPDGVVLIETASGAHHE